MPSLFTLLSPFVAKIKRTNVEFRTYPAPLMNWIRLWVNSRPGVRAETDRRVPRYPQPVRLRERLAFLRQFQDQFASTGAIQPSSRFLARAMTEPLRDRRPAGGVRIVEMGPGTGAVTRGIVEAMGPEDELDCFELNPDFADYLRQVVASEPAFDERRAQINIHTGDASHAQIDAPADFVICSVPLNNLPSDAVRAILDAGLRVLAGQGWFTYFEYVLLPRLHRAAAASDERLRIRAVKGLKSDFRAGGAWSRLVMLNLPPARAVHVPISANRP